MPKFNIEVIMMHKKVILIIVLLILGAGIMCISIALNPYEKDYFGKLGLPQIFSFDDMKKAKGVPLAMRENSYGDINVYYDGLCIVFLGGGTPLFVRAEITSDAYQFGRRALKVGDSRKKVESVCRWRRKVKDALDNEIEIIEMNEGREVWVTFEFDQNNRVDKIILTNGI